MGMDFSKNKKTSLEDALYDPPQKNVISIG